MLKLITFNSERIDLENVESAFKVKTIVSPTSEGDEQRYKISIKDKFGLTHDLSSTGMSVESLVDEQIECLTNLINNANHSEDIISSALTTCHPFLVEEDDIFEVLTLNIKEYIKSLDINKFPDADKLVVYHGYGMLTVEFKE